MQSREHVVHRVVAGRAFFRVGVGHRRIAHDSPGNEIHQEERRPDHLSVFAEQMHARHRDIGRRERLDNPKFALDLMRRLKERPRRFFAHHESRRRSLEHVSGIGLPAGELANPERRAKTRHLINQVTFEAGLVETMNRANRREVIFDRH